MCGPPRNVSSGRRDSGKEAPRFSRSLSGVLLGIPPLGLGNASRPDDQARTRCQQARTRCQQADRSSRHPRPSPPGGEELETGSSSRITEWAQYYHEGPDNGESEGHRQRGYARTKAEVGGQAGQTLRCWPGQERKAGGSRSCEKKNFKKKRKHKGTDSPAEPLKPTQSYGPVSGF